jgi:hypothetical protein
VTCSGNGSSLCFVLLCARLGISLFGLAKSLTRSFQGGLIDLAIAFDDVDGYTRAVGEGGDLFGALVPTHRGGATEEGLGEDDGLICSHVETVSKCLVIEWCNSLLVDILPSFRQIIDQIFGAQRLGRVCENYLRGGGSWGCLGRWGRVLQSRALPLERSDKSLELSDGGLLVCHGS